MSGLMVLALAGASISVMAVHGTAAQASMVQQRSADFNIPAQSASAALREFSRQAGVQVLFSSDAVAGMRTNALTGRHTHGRALSILLAGTPLEAVRNGARQYSVRIPRNARTTAAVRGESNAASGRAAQRQTRLAANGPTRRSATSAAGAAQGQNGQTAETGALLAAAIEDEERRRNEVIVVTGTNIRGIAPESSPAQVYDREDIQNSGVSTVEQFIDRLPQNFGGGSSADVPALPNDRNAAFNRTRGSGVNLRGLGSGATLVLLNGRRLAPSGEVGDFVDVSTIPLSAIEQIDVVADGASAIYGADAIAGVVNFRLREDYEGIEVYGRHGTATEGGVDEIRAGVTLGTEWNSGSILFSYDFYDRDSLGAEERDFSINEFLPHDLLPEQERHSALLSITQDLSESFTLRGHGIYSKRDTQFFSSIFGFGFPRFSDTSSEQYGFSVSLESALGGDWLLVTSADFHSVSEIADITGSFPAQRDIDSELWSIDVLLNGTAFHVPGGDVKVAFGLSYREEDFSNFNGLSDAFENDAEREVAAAYAETLIPIFGPDNRQPGLERLEITLAGRYDDFSEFGDTFNPKIGVVWSPLSGLRFRGTFGTSFNPPNLAEIGNLRGGIVNIRFRPDPLSPNGSSLVLLNQTAADDLGPEEATTWTAGVDYTKEFESGSFEARLTYFDIEFDGRIDTPTNSISSILPNSDLFSEIIVRNPDPALVDQVVSVAQSQAGVFDFSGGAFQTGSDIDVLIDNRLRNLARANTSGVDLNLSYRTRSSIGNLDFSFNSNYIFEQERGITPQSPLFDVVDTIFNPADLRLRGGATWTRDGFAASLFVNYVDGYSDNRVSPAVPVDSWTTVDLNLSYDAGERERHAFLRNIRFSLSVLNLFDQDPPFIASDQFTPNAFDPTNSNPLGRFVALQITKSW
ncbi:TonB-dependent receptor [Parasphingopyxis algicola]|uniref:TonB-dependent receptor n=1 Tax=Parasphingopyxis algicola TaxID=2026624 RepID=UPI0015A49149|nr:TonB-dependent receptor [Parasphingopyxis algicola]QLC24893.1 TonB-dependent receptor [Parasphingopyxis algicola]